MKKVQPSKNTMNMDFLSAMDKPISSSSPAPVIDNTNPAPENSPVETETFIDPVTMDFTESSSDAQDSIPEEYDEPQRVLKETQIVMRVSDQEKEAMKRYFMKHGVSLSKGLKIAVKYLEQQEKKGQVHFSDIGLF